MSDNKYTKVKVPYGRDWLSSNLSFSVSKMKIVFKIRAFDPSRGSTALFKINNLFCFYFWKIWWSKLAFFRKSKIFKNFWMATTVGLVSSEYHDLVSNFEITPTKPILAEQKPQIQNLQESNESTHQIQRRNFRPSYR